MVAERTTLCTGLDSPLPAHFMQHQEHAVAGLNLM